MWKNLTIFKGYIYKGFLGYKNAILTLSSILRGLKFKRRGIHHKGVFFVCRG